MLTDSLLRALSLPRVAFADDLKFAADVISHTQQEIQAEINKVSNWADQHHMPLSVEKNAVVHCGNNQPNFKYTLNNRSIPVVNSVTDLGVVRSTSSANTEHCQAAISKASRAAHAIHRAFSSRDRVLLWSTFQFFVLPIIMYCSPV